MCEGPIFHTCQEMYSNNVDLLRYNFFGNAEDVHVFKLQCYRPHGVKL